MLKIAGNRGLESDMFDKMIMINLAICLSLDNENIAFDHAINIFTQPMGKSAHLSVAPLFLLFVRRTFHSPIKTPGRLPAVLD